MLKNMNPENVKKAMEQVEQMLDSNVVEEYFGNDDKLETARLQMLANLDQCESMMPGFKNQAKDVLAFPVKWRQAMNAAKEQIVQLKNMRAQQKSAGQTFDPSASLPDTASE